MRLLLESDKVPRRKSKPKPNPLERYEPYVQLRALILNQKMKPYQEAGLLFTPDDVKQTGLKWPWRTAQDQLRRLLRGSGLAADYQVVKYETDTPGHWFVKVRYQPPNVAAPAGFQRRRGRPKSQAPYAARLENR